MLCLAVASALHAPAGRTNRGAPIVTSRAARSPLEDVSSSAVGPSPRSASRRDALRFARALGCAATCAVVVQPANAAYGPASGAVLSEPPTREFSFEELENLGTDKLKQFSSSAYKKRLEGILADAEKDLAVNALKLEELRRTEGANKDGTKDDVADLGVFFSLSQKTCPPSPDSLVEDSDSNLRNPS